MSRSARPVLDTAATGYVPAGYSPCVAYVDQFDHLIRAEDRGKAIKSTQTIVVFDDGLVVCAVRVYGDAARPGGAPFGGLRRGSRAGRSAPGRGDEQIRASGQLLGSSVAFAPTWPKARLLPLPVIEKVVLTRPRQVTELAIHEQAGDPADGAVSTYLGDLSADRVHGALGPLLGHRLEIQVTG